MTVYTILAMNQILAAVLFTFALNAKHLFQEKTEKNPKEGMDERHELSTQQSTEDLIQMNQNIRKYGILQTLENKNVSQHHKLALINEFEYLWQISK